LLQYHILDLEKDVTYKYGVCGDPLEPDGSSPRGNDQAQFFNKIVGYFRFIAHVLISGISGRQKARTLFFFNKGLV